MKRIALYFFIFSLFLNCYAINWFELRSPSGKIVYLDTDSILETNKYYFYNIKFQFKNDNDIQVYTIQSSKFHPFSAKIKQTSTTEYEKLKGDYENIQRNATDNLELVSYKSVINTCFNKVLQIKSTDKIKIEF